MTALVVVPLSVRDRLAGALAVFARGGNGFSAAELEGPGPARRAGAPALEAGRLQRALQASELRFKTAFEYSPTGLAISGAEGRYLAVSPPLCEMLGYSEAELLELDYFTLTHPDDRELGRERARQLQDGELDGYRVTKRYLHRDGRTVWAELSVTAVRDDAGAVVQLISQAQDITARKLAQDKLAESLSLLEDCPGDRGHRHLRRLAHARQAGPGRVVEGLSQDLRLRRADLRRHPGVVLAKGPSRRHRDGSDRSSRGRR